MDVRRAERTSGRTKCDVPSRASGRCREIDRLFSECSGRVDQRGSHSCAWHLKPACLTNPERSVRTCRLWQRNSAATPENSAAFWAAMSSLFRVLCDFCGLGQSFLIVIVLVLIVGPKLFI